MSATGGDVGQAGSTQDDEPMADLVAHIGDRVADGETVDLTTLAAEYPDGVEELRQLMPAFEMIARLRLKPAPAVCRYELDSSAMTLFEPMITLGDFHIVRVLGRGGMGVVYEAVQVSLEPPRGFEDPANGFGRRPAKAQAVPDRGEAAALLNDPHIVPVHLVGSENGIHFYVMQLIEGRTCRAHF